MTVQGTRYHRFSRSAALAGISALAMAVAGAAQAAETTSNAPEEIIVTAQRRNEKLQDVPVAIVAQTGAQLQRAAVTNIRDLVTVAPGVQIAGAGLNVAPSIRGVFSGQSDPGNDGNIAIYIDDVYQASQAGNAMDLPDVDRVEILKGPQGTLFGRNAGGGAIRIYTAKPSMDHYTGDIKVGYGSFNQYLAEGKVSGPIIEDRLAFSISGQYKKDDGYHYDIIHNRGNGGRRSNMLRAKLLLEPTDNLKIELFGSYNYHKDNDVQAYVSWQGSNVIRLTNPGTTILDGVHTGYYNFTSNYPPDLKNMTYEGGAKITYTTPWGDIVSNTAFTHTHVFYDDDADFTTVNYTYYPAKQHQKDAQSELLFNSKKFGAFQFTVGANYYGNTGQYNPLGIYGDAFSAFGGGFIVNGRQRTDSYAGFGDANLDITDRLTLIAGVRYSSEKRAATSGLGAAEGHEPRLGKVIYTATTPRASIKYRFTDEDDNAYFTFSQGFHAGGFNISGSQATPFSPEHITAYEVGVKTSPSRVVSANVSAFYYKYSNQQVEVITGFTNSLINAAHSRMYGFDGDINGRLTDDLSVNVSFAYLNAKYESFPGAAVIDITQNCGAGNAPGSCGGSNGVADLSGHSEPFAPKFTGGAGVNYHHDFDFGLVEASAHVYYSAPFIWVSQLEALKNPRYATVALTASYTPAGSHFTFGAWGKNLTSAKYYASTFISPISPGVSYAEPASGGFNIKYAF